MIEKIAVFVIIALVTMVACGFVATVPIATRGVETVRVDAPRHLSEVFVGADDITVPVVWSGSDSTETYAAVLIPGGQDPAILISRKVNNRDALTFYDAGLYQRLKREGRVELEVDFMSFKPAQVELQPPDPVAMALQAVMHQDMDGKYFTWVDGEVKVNTRINIFAVAPAPTIHQVWVDHGETPKLYVQTETFSQQAALQWVTIYGDKVTQGTSPFIQTEECGQKFCATFQYPVPLGMTPKSKLVTGIRLLDGSGLYSDYFLGWEVEGTTSYQNLATLTEAETRNLVKDHWFYWYSGPAPRLNPPMFARGTGDKPNNPGVYQWFEELITKVRGGEP